MKRDIKKEKSDNYVLTRDEFCRMLDNFYQVKSAVDILEQHCSDIGYQGIENKNMQDVANCLAMVMEKLEPIERLLGK